MSYRAPVIGRRRPPPDLPRLYTRPGAPAVTLVIALAVVPELLLSLADAGYLGAPGWRESAYRLGAFWAGLLHGSEPVYPGQAAVMFASHAFLHDGALHLLGNMAAVMALGGIAVARTGQRGFLVLYVVAMLGGATGAALLAPADAAPMVGASGAVFGLVGAWKFWEWEARRIFRARMAPLWWSLAAIGLINLLLWLALSGLLAWEAHLGGMIAGAGWAALFTRTHRAAW
ncbi:rhomboid family intramembrane serine protease [Rhodobacteraceae bacterium WD3A24]|nr:rhomboid family intramembrane serine protease [Rhodobacteraceae bacterium WD3A24]